MAVVTPEVSIKLDHDEVLRVNEYRILSTIGRGAFSEVVLAQKDEHFFAIKWLDRVKLSRQGAFVGSRGAGSTALSPLELVSNDVVATGAGLLPAAHIVPALEVIGDGGRDLFIVQEFAEAGAIMVPLNEEDGTYLASFGGIPSPLGHLAPGRPDAGLSGSDESPQCFPEDIARVIFRSILVAVKACHEQGIAHRDVKPENVVASADGRVRLTDFSSCFLFVKPTDDLLVKAIDALVTGNEVSTRDAHLARLSMSASHRTDREVRQLHAKDGEHKETAKAISKPIKALSGSGSSSTSAASAIAPSRDQVQSTPRVDNFDATPRPPAPGTKPPRPSQPAPETSNATEWNDDTLAEFEAAKQPESAGLAGSQADGITGNQSIADLSSSSSSARVASDSPAFVGSSTVTDTQGTPAFFPPEACTALDESRSAGADISFDSFKQDSWAAGVTLYCLLFAQHPFASAGTPTAEELFVKIAGKKVGIPRKSPDGSVRLVELSLEMTGASGATGVDGAKDVDEDEDENGSHRFISADAERLLLGLLAADPQQRLSVEAALKHPWFGDGTAGEFTECPQIDLEALEPYDSMLVDQLREDRARGGSGVLTAANKTSLQTGELGDLGLISAPGSAAAPSAKAEDQSDQVAAGSGTGGVSSGGSDSATGKGTSVVREPANLKDRGFLAKRGRILKSWKQRWVYVRAGCLYYFSEEVPDVDALSEADLDAKASGEALVLGGQTHVSPQPKPKKPYRFSVEVEGRQLFMQAADQSDLDVWMESIRFWAAKAKAAGSRSQEAD